MLNIPKKQKQWILYFYQGKFPVESRLHGNDCIRTLSSLKLDCNKMLMHFTNGFVANLVSWYADASPDLQAMLEKERYTYLSKTVFDYHEKPYIAKNALSDLLIWLHQNEIPLALYNKGNARSSDIFLLMYDNCNNITKTDDCKDYFMNFSFKSRI